MILRQSREKRFISFVVCVGDEERTADTFLSELIRLAEEMFESWEVIVVLNGSPDGTGRAIRETVKSSAGVILITLAWRHDEELAMLAGTDFAIGDLIYEIESPYRDWPLEILATLYEKCLAGNDIVSAVPHRPLSLGSKLFYYLLRKMSYLNLELTTEELRLVSRRSLNAVLSAKETTRYRKALYKSSGFPCATVTYKPLHEKRKRPQDGLLNRIGTAFDVLISFSSFGYNIGILFSILFLILSVGIGIFAIDRYLVRKEIASGWTTLSLFLSFGFSGIFLVLGLLGKYLSIALIELQQRSPYRVSSVMRIEKQ
jgi:glycosyltransferase involved in cell wall biosynthesis